METSIRNLLRQRDSVDSDSRKYISLQELSQHNKLGDLWISIQGKVYDVTQWSNDHPGGAIPLLSFAGQDVTDAFIAYHPGTAWQHLDRLFTGYHLHDYSVSEASMDYRKLLSEFTKMGLFDKKGHVTCITLIFMATMFALSVSGVLFSDSAVVHLACGAMIGSLWIQCGWICHDSGHYRVTSGPLMNRFVQLLTGNCLMGVSVAWWKQSHNAHHIACNSLDFDPNLQHMPFFAVSSKLFDSITSYYHNQKVHFGSVARFLVSYQHLTFYPVMCFSRVYIHAQSFLFLISNWKVPNRGQEILGIALFWIWYPLLVSCLPNWSERVMFIAVSFAVTGIQQVQFYLNHISSPVYVGRPNSGDWLEKQTGGSLDIQCPPWMDWFHGGLQFQIEHHLFPRLPRGNLRKVSPFVKEVCKKHNLPYNSASFWKANAMIINTLCATALQARDLTRPVPRNMVWEAVNTHG